MRNLIRGLVAALLLAALPVVSEAGLFVSVTIAPPPLPVYEQPPIPGPGYIWTPGYWAWDGSYYWVPGTWVIAPVGLLWTPGYWGWVEGAYVWNAGYWGPHVGFYGGVDYGFGYTGVGFYGGEWRGREFYYNRSVTNITTNNITNVYNRTVVNNVNVTRVSYNGGAGGVEMRPNAAEIAADRERHMQPLQVQAEHRTMAAHDNLLRASVNGGHPAIAATPRPREFTGAGVVAARGANATHMAAATHGETSNRETSNRGGTAYPQGREYSQQTHSGPYPQGRESSQPRGGNYPQGREYSQQPRGGGYPQGREYSPPHANSYPQPRPGGYSQPRANPAQPAARPEQGRGQSRGNERPEREEHPH